MGSRRQRHRRFPHRRYPQPPDGVAALPVGRQRPAESGERHAREDHGGGRGLWRRYAKSVCRAETEVAAKLLSADRAVPDRGAGPRERRTASANQHAGRRAAAGALAGRTLARLREPLSRRHRLAAARSRQRRGAVVAVPRRIRRPDRPARELGSDAWREFHAGFPRARHDTGRQALVGGDCVGRENGDSLHGRCRPASGTPHRCQPSHHRGSGHGAPRILARALARRPAGGVLGARENLADGAAGWHAATPQRRQRGRVPTGLGARRQEHRLCELGGHVRRWPSVAIGPEGQAQTPHARGGLLRLAGHRAGRQAHRGAAHVAAGVDR